MAALRFLKEHKRFTTQSLSSKSVVYVSLPQTRLSTCFPCNKKKKRTKEYMFSSAYTLTTLQVCFINKLVMEIIFSMFEQLLSLMNPIIYLIKSRMDMNSHVALMDRETNKETKKTYLELFILLKHMKKHIHSFIRSFTHLFSHPFISLQWAISPSHSGFRAYSMNVVCEVEIRPGCVTDP